MKFSNGYLCVRGGKITFRLFGYGNVRHHFVADDVEKQLCCPLLWNVLHPMGIAHQLLFKSDDGTRDKGRMVAQVELRHEGDALGFFHRGKSFVWVADNALDIELVDVAIDVLLESIDGTLAYVWHNDWVLK